jgi:hypothetical protein
MGAGTERLMARRRQPETATFEGMPVELRFRAGQSRGQTEARRVWLDSNGLSLVDYFAWLSSQTPHVPARRKGPLPADNRKRS